MITGSPVAGNLAYLGANGQFSPTQVSGAPLMGRFLTGLGSDGTAKVYVKIA